MSQNIRKIKKLGERKRERERENLKIFCFCLLNKHHFCLFSKEKTKINKIWNDKTRISMLNLLKIKEDFANKVENKQSEIENCENHKKREKIKKERRKEGRRKKYVET